MRLLDAAGVAIVLSIVSPKVSCRCSFCVLKYAFTEIFFGSQVSHSWVTLKNVVIPRRDINQQNLHFCFLISYEIPLFLHDLCISNVYYPL